MPNRSPLAAASPIQPTLFHGSLNFDHDLRHQLTLAIDGAPIGRKEIAARMSDLAASRVSVDTLNAWTAPSRAKWNLPVRLAVAFDVVTGGTRVLDFLASKHGRTVLSVEEAVDAELGRLEREEAAIRARRAAILALSADRPSRA